MVVNMPTYSSGSCLPSFPCLSVLSSFWGVCLYLMLSLQPHVLLLHCPQGIILKGQVTI